MISLNLGIFIAFTVILMSIFILSKKKGGSKTSTNTAFGSAGKNNELTVILQERQKLSHDTFNFVFTLPNKDQTLGVPIGKHYIVNAKVGNENVQRKYTPTSVVDQKGTFEQVIKIYRANVHPKFPEGGKLTQYLEQLPIGSELYLTGPHGNLEYKGNGSVVIDRSLEDAGIQKATFKKFFMVAGGTGLTPMYQIIQQVCNDPSDKTELYLLYANKSEEDILLRNELEEYSKTGKLKLSFTLDVPPSNWKYFGGFVSLEMMKKSFNSIDSSTLCCSCGPLPMTNLAKKLFDEMGCKEQQYFKF